MYAAQVFSWSLKLYLSVQKVMLLMNNQNSRKRSAVRAVLLHIQKLFSCLESALFTGINSQTVNQDILSYQRCTFRKLFSKSILWVPLRNLPGLMLPVLTIYAMLSMQIIMMQDDIRFAQTVRLTTCFNPAVLLLHRRITSTYKPRNYETVTALTIAFAAILANVHIFSSLEPLHCVAGVIWLIFHYILFAWFEHFKQAKHLNAAHELLTIFTALCAFSLFLFIIDSRLLEVFQYFEMNKHHSFPYIVFPALVFSIACFGPRYTTMVRLCCTDAVRAVGRMAKEGNRACSIYFTFIDCVLL
ncbi:hypothetical protein D918_07057 [Trichuris suis]|nr:hypothetical protein D918_07057 [Trichuris suis]